MATTTIIAGEFEGYDYEDSEATLYLFASQSFLTAEGKPITQGSYEKGQDWRFKFDCTIEGGILSVPEMDVDSTTDSDSPGAQWIAVLVAANGEIRPFFVSSFRLPVTESGQISWAGIRTFNNARRLMGSEPDYLNTTQQFITFIQRSELEEVFELGGLAPDATTVIKGKGVISVAPVDPETPIFVGDNDPRFAEIAEALAIMTGGEFSYE